MNQHTSAPGTIRREYAYHAWLNDVEAAVEKLIGLSRKDLDDYPYRDAFDAGEEVYDVARCAIEASGYDTD